MSPKPLEEFVVENRRDVVRVEEGFVEAANQRDPDLYFSRNTVEIDPSIEVYSRDLGNALISGHPNGTVHGSGHGVSGFHRGPWSKDTSVSQQSGTLTREGRNVVRDALAGERSAHINEIAVGDGTSAASPSDTSLDNRIGSTEAWGKSLSGGKVAAKGVIGWEDHEAASITEFGLFDSQDRMLARIVTDDVAPTLEEDLRIDITLTVTGDGVGDSTITSDGEQALADALASPNSVAGVEAVLFGTGTTEAAQSDTEMENLIIGKTVERTREPETLLAHGVLLVTEPSEQPLDLSEVGIRSGDGTLIWRVTTQPFHKNNDYAIDAYVGFRIR